MEGMNILKNDLDGPACRTNEFYTGLLREWWVVQKGLPLKSHYPLMMLFCYLLSIGSKIVGNGSFMFTP
jgi:hypothetical protein